MVVNPWRGFFAPNWPFLESFVAFQVWHFNRKWITSSSCPLIRRKALHVDGNEIQNGFLFGRAKGKKRESASYITSTWNGAANKCSQNGAQSPPAASKPPDIPRHTPLWTTKRDIHPIQAPQKQSPSAKRLIGSGDEMCFIHIPPPPKMLSVAAVLVFNGAKCLEGFWADTLLTGGTVAAVINVQISSSLLLLYSLLFFIFKLLSIATSLPTLQHHFRLKKTTHTHAHYDM